MSTSSSSGYRHHSYSRSSSNASTTSISSENLPPRTLQRVAREVRDLHKSPPDGIKLVVDPETGCSASLGEVIAEMAGPPGTPYEDRFFQLKLVVSSDFPSSPSRGFFLTKIYHPNVDVGTGAICVNTLKKDWNSTTTFSHVLSVIRCLLIVPFPESSLNDEAGKLFMDSYEEYARRARLMTNVHGRSLSFSVISNGSIKLGGDDLNRSVSSSGVLTDSMNSATSDASGDDTRLKGALKQRKSSKKLATEKKNKKKSLKRL